MFGDSHAEVRRARLRLEIAVPIAVKPVCIEKSAEGLRACLRLKIIAPIAPSPFVFGDNHAEERKACFPSEISIPIVVRPV